VAGYIAKEYLTPGGRYYNGPTLAGMNKRYATKGSMSRVNWNAIALIVTVGVYTKVIQDSGIVNGVANLLSDTTPLWVVIGLMYLLGVLMCTAMKPIAVASILLPIALKLGADLGFDQRALALAVLAGTLTDFLTPIGSIKGTISFDLAGYTFKDYLKVGVPLTLISTVVLMIWLSIYFGSIRIL
jgi:di/tricarboxylate transporter